VVRASDGPSHCRGAGCVSTPPRFAVPHHPWGRLRWRAQRPLPSMITAPTWGGQAGRVGRAGTARLLAGDAWIRFQWSQGATSCAGFGRVLASTLRPVGKGPPPIHGLAWQVVSELASTRLRLSRHAAAAGDRSLQAPLTGQRQGAGLFGDDDATAAFKALGDGPSRQVAGAINGQSPGRQGKDHPAERMRLPLTSTGPVVAEACRRKQG